MDYPKKIVYPMETSCHTILAADGTIHHNCNKYLFGNLANYTIWMEKTYGRELVLEFLAIENRWRAGKIKAPGIKEMRKIYNERLAQLRQIEKKKGLQLAPKSWKEE